MARAGFVSRRDMLQNELQTIESEGEAAAAALKELVAQIEATDAEEQQAREIETRLVAESKAVSDELARLEENARALATLIETTQGKLDLLATLEQKGPRSHSALKMLKATPVNGLLELLGDTVDVDDAYRRALQAALGPAAYYYLTESVDAALEAMEVLRSKNAGQTTFLSVADYSGRADGEITLPEGTLVTALSVLNGQSHNPVLEKFLDRVVIVKDWSAATRHFAWARKHGCMLVTLDGQWMRGDGLMFGGSGESGLPVDLGLTRQMADLRQRLSGAQAQREATVADIRSHRATLARIEQELGHGRRELAAVAARRVAVREKQVKSETRLTTLDERAQSVHAQIADLERQTTECEQRLTAAQEATQTAEHELKAAESSGEEITRRLYEEQRVVSLERDRRHNAERERDAVRHRLELLQSDARRIAETLAEIDENMATARQNAEQAANELVILEARLQELDTDSVEKYRTRDAAAQAVDQISQRIDGVRTQIAEQDERLHTLRESHSGELEGERRIERDIARLRGELDAVVSGARNQFAFELAAPDFAEQNPEILKTEATPELLQECRGKIDRLGPVNSLAVEEYDRENTRLEGMLQQRDDLLKAKKTLEETIARINETAQARFLHTFEAVRQHFQRLFQEFFPAGEADLILSGQDLLEADITLWANPSGKRLKSLSLMSGGEKTMTAIALLFALYQVKPSPFCVFDEVDAPLDDANIDRFNRVIRMHAENTQFILITHNRRTMEIADNLYGVTMEEEGVSKLVSVRLLSSIA